MEYTELQKLAIDTGKAFIEKKIAPMASLIDDQEIFPFENFKELGRMGLLGINYPEEYDGAGLDYIAYTGFVREVAKVCASTAMTIVSHSSLACNPIYSFGSEDQKIKYLKPLIKGEKIGAFALTEPNSGSDISSMQTKAVEHEDYYLLNGNKIFITNANVADLYIVAAKTAPEKNILGISIFLLEKGMSGLKTSEKKERKLGMRGSDTGELIFENVKVPKENLIGKKNYGFKILHNTLITARLGMAAIAIGIAEGAQKICLQYVKQRKQFGKYLYHFQSVKNILADMEMNINAASLLLYKACRMKDEGKQISKEASEAKLFASEMTTKVTKDAIQLLGAYGYSKDFPLERFFRDAKITEIGDGTSEIQRLIIADEIIKRNS
ncbi:acyl-CoA dehydrogenase family protein [Paramaledivibacter caminithermalis]|jgi:butyryl-CoA dehydrogenase/acyl-CoA dehydrogenase|uniref:Acyl-CoA dehydrogenase n=1 Tax=Paramaledivibacter caminithermalis (strain DSM 15212 / CIP 107654 / DViRD3) TaxID=1121301 RepID=A0A1M6PQY8_PARC5|nr:acyl-CoA dehydrogenase family protein [Paramaledivibacter caminithermalis]SHK10312.1 acyl-CoA dehydrogenase [Paramaledivibacter caminithermalis DSM 15212]